MLKNRHFRHPLRTVRVAGSLLLLHGGALLRCFEGWFRFRHDPRFQLEAVRKGFSDRRTFGVRPETFIRICRAYRAAIELPEKKEFEATEWWYALRQTSLRPVLTALEQSDAVALEQMYGNFYRDSCSDGLVGKTLLLSPSLPEGLRVIHQHAYLTEALCRIDRWRSLTSCAYNIADLSGPEIGNPFGLSLEGSLIAFGAEHSHYGARRIIELTQNSEATVLEIGGGFGCMAQYLLRDSPHIRYWNFDLPESLALAAAYLIRSFPANLIALYGEAAGSSFGDGAKISLLPLSELHSMPAACVDIVFSAHAMSDLSETATRVYLQQVRRLSSRFFLYQGMLTAANHLEQIIADDYPAFTLIEKKEYFLHGPSRRNHLQCELLYALNT